jgi:putative FmdB family regulatory protein
MPTYEYVCTKCDHHFEKFQSMKDKPLEVCPKDLCPQKKWGKGKVKKQVGMGAGLIFKGSGFYSTDYRSEGYKTAAKKDTAPATAAAPAASTSVSPAAAPASAPAASSSAGGQKPAAKADKK